MLASHNRRKCSSWRGLVSATRLLRCATPSLSSAAPDACRTPRLRGVRPGSGGTASPPADRLRTYDPRVDPADADAPAQHPRDLAHWVILVAGLVYALGVLLLALAVYVELPG